MSGVEFYNIGREQSLIKIDPMVKIKERDLTHDRVHDKCLNPARVIRYCQSSTHYNKSEGTFYSVISRDIL